MAKGMDGDMPHTPQDTVWAAARMNDIVAQDIVLPYSMRTDGPKPLNVEPAYIEELEEDLEDE
jgi:hypothetical protein